MDMDKILVADNSLISVWAYPERKLIHSRQKMYSHGDDFRDALNKGTDAMELYKATKWLSDTSVHGGLPPEDEAWVTQTWFPRTKAAGWRHWAVVKPTKIIGQLNLSRFIKTFADLGINACMFSDPVEAMKWLDDA
jgi:hypothetical protein